VSWGNQVGVWPFGDTHSSRLRPRLCSPSSGLLSVLGHLSFRTRAHPLSDFRALFFALPGNAEKWPSAGFLPTAVPLRLKLQTLHQGTQAFCLPGNGLRPEPPGDIANLCHRAELGVRLQTASRTRVFFGFFFSLYYRCPAHQSRVSPPASSPCPNWEVFIIAWIQDWICLRVWKTRRVGAQFRESQECARWTSGAWEAPEGAAV
jgi:hypothetical protein